MNHAGRDRKDRCISTWCNAILLKTSAAAQDYSRLNDASSGKRNSGFGDHVIVIDPSSAPNGY